MTKRDATWRAVSLGAGAAAAVSARWVMATIWKTGTGGAEPPRNPADRTTSWPQALTWAMALGIGAGVARVVAQRSAAAAWEAATDAPPPGIQLDALGT